MRAAAEDTHELTALDPLSGGRTTLTDLAVTALRAAILDGRLQAGGLYSVARLAQQLGVSRTPVREALLLLERQGMVRFERNRGARVLDSTARDLDEIFSLRLLLEVPAARRAAELITPADLALLKQELEAMRAQARAGDEPAFMAHDRRFHETLLAASGNRRLVEVVGSLRDTVRLRGASTVGRGRDLRAIHREHVRILDALRARDADAVARELRAHLLNTRRLLLLAADPAADAAALDADPWAARGFPA
ncbi:MAG TPA: GntR family transcriptional regulator [Conexibacter sp.]